MLISDKKVLLWIHYFIEKKQMVSIEVILIIDITSNILHALTHIRLNITTPDNICVL